MSKESLVVKIAGGDTVACPDVRLPPTQLRSTDVLYATHGFGHSLTVMRDGAPVGFLLVDELNMANMAAFVARFGERVRAIVVTSELGL